mmetsp:Transcript_16694/g.47595  ORF Transcript_16694/g.47595 Transcript_16694/m.47595 type:complete len:242 (+) Transcript_16694:910-1635(+)
MPGTSEVFKPSGWRITAEPSTNCTPHVDWYMPFPMSAALGLPSFTGVSTFAASTVRHFGPSNFSQHTRRSSCRSGSHIRLASVAAASRASAQMPTQTQPSRECSARSKISFLNLGSRASRLKRDSAKTHSYGAQYLSVSMLVSARRDSLRAVALRSRSSSGLALPAARDSPAIFSSSYRAVVCSCHHSNSVVNVVSISDSGLLNLLSWNVVSRIDATVRKLISVSFSSMLSSCASNSARGG